MQDAGGAVTGVLTEDDGGARLAYRARQVVLASSSMNRTPSRLLRQSSMRFSVMARLLLLRSGAPRWYPFFLACGGSNP